MMSSSPPLLRSTSALALAGVLLAAPLASAEEPHGPKAAPVETDASSNTERARELFERGAAAWDAKRFEEARALFGEAWQSSRSYDVAAGLGQAELKLGRHRDAAEHLHYAVRNFPVGANRLLLAGLEKKLEEAKRHVGSVRVSVDEPSAHVLIDGIDVGVVPPDGYLFVEPGQRRFRALFDAMPSSLEVVEAQAGGEYSVQLTIVRESGSPAVERPSEGTATGAGDARTQGKSLVPVYVGAGLVATGLALRVGFGIAASNARSDVDSYRRRNGESGCSDGTADAAVCGASRDAFDRERQSVLLGNVGLGVAVTAAVATLGYMLFWPEPKPSQAGLRPNVAFDARGGSLGLSGEF